MVLFDCAIIRLDRELQLRKINCSAWYTETFFYILISSAILERESSNCLNAPTGIAPNHKVFSELHIVISIQFIILGLYNSSDFRKLKTFDPIETSSFTCLQQAQEFNCNISFQVLFLWFLCRYIEYKH